MVRPPGVYLNLVEGLLWVQDVVSSNPTTPTNAFTCERPGPLSCPGTNRI